MPHNCRMQISCKWKPSRVYYSLEKMQATPCVGGIIFSRYSTFFTSQEKFSKFYGKDDLFVEGRIIEVDELSCSCTVFYPSILDSHKHDFKFFKDRKNTKKSVGKSSRILSVSDFFSKEPAKALKKSQHNAVVASTVAVQSKSVLFIPQSSFRSYDDVPTLLYSGPKVNNYLLVFKSRFVLALYQTTITLHLQSRANQMKKLLPPALAKEYQDPRLQATRNALRAKLETSLDIFSPMEELFLFIQTLGQVLHANMNSKRCVPIKCFSNISHIILCSK